MFRLTHGREKRRDVIDVIPTRQKSKLIRSSCLLLLHDKRNDMKLFTAILVNMAISLGSALSSTNAASNRRNFFQQVVAASAATTTAYNIASPAAFALDMDAFVDNAIQQDTSKQAMTDDERTCKYAAPGRAKGDACERAGMSTTKGGKKKGVDAYGNTDRGDFIRCTTTYPNINGKYVKTVTCE